MTSNIRAFLIAAAVAFTGTASAQDFLPSRGQVPYVGPMGPGSMGAPQFLPDHGYADPRGPAGTAEWDPRMQPPGSMNCDDFRYSNRRLRNDVNGFAAPIPDADHRRMGF